MTETLAPEEAAKAVVARFGAYLPSDAEREELREMVESLMSDFADLVSSVCLESTYR